MTVKRANAAVGDNIKSAHYSAGFMTGEEDWKSVVIKFDIESHKCDVAIDDETVMSDVRFDGVEVPKTLAVAVCGAAANNEFMLAVNDVTLEDRDIIDLDDEAGEQERCELMPADLEECATPS